MSVRWTEEQQKVIDLRERNILVSAAAGSGKTAVLVERIITMLTRSDDPVSVDELLIVTFTEAAAAEMKERIRDAIEKKLAECPGDEHLLLQATLIHSARITTIHSFCLSVIKEHFHTIELDPAFRVGEEGELKLLKHDVLGEVLESHYSEGGKEFLDFVDSYAGGRDDKKLEELILNLYEFSRSHPDYRRWLQKCVDNYQPETEQELNASEMFQVIRRNVRRYMEDAMRLAEQGLAVCREADGPYMYEEALMNDKQIIQRYLEAEGYTDYYLAAEKTEWMRLAANRSKTASEEKASFVKRIREELKDIVKDVKEQYFTQDVENVLEDLRLCRPMMEILALLVDEFSEAFEEKKKSQNMIDFDDMEQYALRILTEKDEEGNLVPSKAAAEYQEQFREIMIDEYQDSNLIQEAILTSVSGISRGRYNIFMVGDVKQSIYRFRLSRPELFMEKFDTYDREDGKKQRIDLHKNFRSRSEVLDSVNFLFEQLMTKPLGGITYDEKAALYVGADYETSAENETEVLLVDAEMEHAEARAVARRVKDLMCTKQVTDKKTGVLRPVKYSDIVILTRSMKGWGDVFASVLTEEGIPVYAGSTEGYFETREIGVLLDYLRVLNNRQQDIPLTAVLSSFFGGVTCEELAVIRSAYPQEPFWRGVTQYLSEGENETIKEKLRVCFEQMDWFCEKIPYTALHDLLLQILNDTGYGDYVAALPGGEQRKANVDMLVEKARAFESTSYKGLFHFIRYIEQLQKYQVDYGEASLEDEQSDTVRIMSIHKSKGLEFPIVIVAGMGKRFNQQDARRNVLIHASLGAGLEAVELERRTKIPSLLKRVIQREEVLESLGEELRVLYVAFTRAKEKLIITGMLKGAAQKLEEYDMVRRQKEKELSFGRLSHVTTYWDWLLPALARKTEKQPIILRIIGDEELAAGEIEEELTGVLTRKMLEEWNTESVYDEKMHQELAEQFGYQYPYEQVEGRKMKFTVSELKKRAYLAEEPGELLYREPEVVPLIPQFMQESHELTGASRGSAYHRVMELLDFTREYSSGELKEAVADMAEKGRISGEMAECVRTADILGFLECPCGRRMQRAAGKNLLWKEQPFVLGVDMGDVYPDAEGEEMIVVQGIIDAFFEEEDGLVVLDYKTDKVTKEEQLVEKYHMQLDYYARALSQITGKHVKEKMIYSFELQKEIILY